MHRSMSDLAITRLSRLSILARSLTDLCYLTKGLNRLKGMWTCVIARYTLNMGNLRERGTPFIGTRTSFGSAYPTVERAYVRFTETDFGSSPRERVHNLADGPRAAIRSVSGAGMISSSR